MSTVPLLNRSPRDASMLADFAVFRLMNHGMVNASKLALKFAVPECAVQERLQALDRRCGAL